MANDEQKKRNKTAVALEYNPGEEAPKILATGKGLLAEKIIEKAKEADVPVHKDAKLARTLANLEVGDYIPPELYQAVAEVLLFVDNLDRIKEKAYNNFEE